MKKVMGGRIEMRISGAENDRSRALMRRQGMRLRLIRCRAGRIFPLVALRDDCLRMRAIIPRVNKL